MYTWLTTPLLVTENYVSTIRSAAFITIICLAFLPIWRYGHREKYLPPGPRTIPIIGNAHMMISKDLHLKFKEWSSRQGPIYSLKVFNTTLIVLNCPRAIHALFTKKSALFTDRPADAQWELACHNEQLALMRSGPEWKALRKLAMQGVANPRALDGVIADILENEVRLLMGEFLDAGDEWRDRLAKFGISVAGAVIYGQRAPDWNCFWAKDMDKATRAMVDAFVPGAYLPIERVPFLQHLLPEPPHQKIAKAAYDLTTATFSQARAFVEARRAAGDFRDSLVDKVLDGTLKPDIPLSQIQLDNALFGSLHIGGAETAHHSILTNVLFLAKNAWVQEKARRELDGICGSDRLPAWGDFGRLPYVECIVKEGLRIRPVVPNGIPYRATEDVWYEGMLIPKDANVIVPIWALNNTLYDDPDTYNPDRYLKHPSSQSSSPSNADLDSDPDSEYHPRDHYTFGAGRRSCVGMRMAEQVLWRATAQMLWAFRIEPAVDRNGQPVSLDTDAYEGSLTYAPKPFAVRFVPRSEKHAEVLREAAGGAREWLRRWE